MSIKLGIYYQYNILMNIPSYSFLLRSHFCTRYWFSKYTLSSHYKCECCNVSDIYSIRSQCEKKMRNRFFTFGTFRNFHNFEEYANDVLNE